jgi:hypothetical protein
VAINGNKRVRLAAVWRLVSSTRYSAVLKLWRPGQTIRRVPWCSKSTAMRMHTGRISKPRTSGNTRPRRKKWSGLQSLSERRQLPLARSKAASVGGVAITCASNQQLAYATKGERPDAIDGLAARGREGAIAWCKGSRSLARRFVRIAARTLRRCLRRFLVSDSWIRASRRTSR